MLKVALYCFFVGNKSRWLNNDGGGGGKWGGGCGGGGGKKLLNVGDSGGGGIRLLNGDGRGDRSLLLFELKLRLSFLSAFKGTLSGLRQFLVTQSPLKIMKNVFYFTLKALFITKIFKFLSWVFGNIEKWLD